MADHIVQEDGTSKILLEVAGSLLLETSANVSTVVGKTGTSGTAIMQKTKAGWTNVSQKSGNNTAISQKVVAGYTQVTGH